MFCNIYSYVDTVCMVSFVQVSNWLSEDIVFTENFEERVALVSRLVDIMEVHILLFYPFFILILL